MRSFWYVFLFFCGDFLDLLCCFQSLFKEGFCNSNRNCVFHCVSIYLKLSADHAF